MSLAMILIWIVGISPSMKVGLNSNHLDNDIQKKQWIKI